MTVVGLVGIVGMDVEVSQNGGSDRVKLAHDVVEVDRVVPVADVTVLAVVLIIFWRGK